MTSSLSLHKRKEMADVWNVKNFSLPGATLGGIEDHYVTNIGLTNCRPGFEAVPIGNRYGMGICRRITDLDKLQEDENWRLMAESKWWNGMSKYQADLYDSKALEQKTISNRWKYHLRTGAEDDPRYPGVPNMEYYVLNDYIARDFRFNGTGVEPMRTPFSSTPRGTDKYYEYGFSYTNNPPPKFDTTRLVQPYPVWREEMLGMGLKTPEQLRELDEKWNLVISPV